MTATTTAQHQPGDRVTWTSRHTRKTYTGTVTGPFVADQIAIEQDPQPGDTHRATWHVPASQVRPTTEPVTLALPQPMDHQRKAPRRHTGKPGTPIQRAIAAYRNRTVLTVDGFLASLGADPDTTRRYRSSLGRKVAQAYRAATGNEPQQSGWAVAHHRLIPVYAYTPGQAALLAEVARSYKPTARLIGA